MELKQGNTRIVILIHCLGIAVKIAKINLIFGLRTLLIEPFRFGIRSWWLLFKYQIIWDSRALHTSRYFLFRGTNANWQEFRFYIKTRHQILQPTYFSLFGLINIQKIATKSSAVQSDHSVQFFNLCKKAHGHNFENPDNFCVENGRIKFLDYGDCEVREVVLESGDLIYNKFDPDWDYEEYKKRRDEQSPSTEQNKTDA